MSKIPLILIILLGPFAGFAQDTIPQPKPDSTIVVKKKPPRWDTTRYLKYDYVFIVGFFQQYRNFDNEFVSLMNKDTMGLASQPYSTESNLISGFVFNYDKFQVSFSTGSKPPNGNSGKGHTKTFNLGFNFGDNRWVCENYFRRFRGFYNKNTSSFDSTFKETGQYYVQPGLTSTIFMNRFMYFTNHKKYSFKSGFGCNYRQVESAATFILGGSFNTYSLKNDSSIFPIQARPLYNDYGNLQGFSTVNIGVNAGAAVTFVAFRAWFLMGYFTLGPEQQWRSYNLGGTYRNLSYVSWSGTGRLSFGVNLHKFYFLVSYTNDYNLYNSPKIMNFTSNSITGNFTLGWRFHGKTPEFYKKFQKTKLYKLLG